ncbi:DUF4435 domain-containing protein [Pseudomonas alliivorans]|nr:DUF4435 domain-containing protein [Pseudomonas alliivorans]MEE5153045.1 DUF4435 domain-containing protein [Pseudomonas alliivorans]
MDLKYNIPKYVAMARMSNKVRVLVEGKDDRGHVLNLLQKLYPKIRLKVDSAVEVAGDCAVTKLNNRAKIEKIHSQCKGGFHKSLFFLCDREFRNFDVGSKIVDKLIHHERDGNLSWTLGHSIENYFLSSDLLGEGFRFLSTSGYKTQAVEIFCEVLPEALRKIAALTLAAKELGCASYPAGQISWQKIQIMGGKLKLLRAEKLNDFELKYWSTYDQYLVIATSTSDDVCARVSRGHTAVLILQRVFAAALYKASAGIEEESARYDANTFNNVSESNISSALSEAWIRNVSVGAALYPKPLVESIQAASA